MIDSAGSRAAVKSDAVDTDAAAALCISAS
jgi:hypothetical protein